MLRQNGGKSCPLPEGGDGNVLAFELDDFDGTVVGRLSDAVRIFLEVGPFDDRRRLVTHAEHIGTEVLTDTAESALVINPHFFDRHASYSSINKTPDFHTTAGAAVTVPGDTRR
jgi:hypothetical protein